ncbi:unnamed protein product, partial [Vitis vinifera]
MGETRFLQELVLYAASAALSCLVLFAGLRHLDPNRESSKKALEHRKEIAKRLGRPLIQTNSYEDVIACDVINPDHIDVEFDSIGGLETIKQALVELVILPLRRPELFSHGKLLGPQKGVLLYGPPGTGKTMLAKAIAKESGAVFINVRISNLMSKWFGDAQKLVAAVFSLAYKLQPAIIFIDEVDTFLGQRRTTDHEAMANMKTEFMALWDGFTTDQNARVMVLAATNRPSELDEAILRRLPQAFEIGIPDRRERVEILKVVLKGEKVADDINYDRIASLCEGYTGSDILELCKKAAYFPIRELLDDEKNGKPSPAPRPLSQLDLEKVLATSRKTKVAASEYTGLNPQSSGCFVLRIRKKDKRRILRPYLQHILAKYEEFEKELKLYINCESRRLSDGRWRSVPFTHQATMETVAMDSDLKSKVKSDLELFLKSKQYYQRLGRVWKRSYLLHGAPGTGKSSFVAAMAKLLCYDVYDVDLSQVSDDADLKLLLLQTTPRSLILIEDLDRFLIDKSTTVSLPGVLNFMDGVLSCCGEERVMVFTMNSPDQIDPTVLRPGRIDVHVQFGLCDFSSFKMLADSHLGIKEHRLFPQVEEIFQTGASLCPAEIGEIMTSNRNSATRALKSVINALQTNTANKIRLTQSSSGRSTEESAEPGGVICRESVHTVREFRKLYGLLRRSGRKEEPLDLGSTDKDAPRNGS